MAEVETSSTASRPVYVTLDQIRLYMYLAAESIRRWEGWGLSR